MSPRDGTAVQQSQVRLVGVRVARRRLARIAFIGCAFVACALPASAALDYGNLAISGSLEIKSGPDAGTTVTLPAARLRGD